MVDGLRCCAGLADAPERTELAAAAAAATGREDDRDAAATVAGVPEFQAVHDAEARRQALRATWREFFSGGSSGGGGGLGYDALICPTFSTPAFCETPAASPTDTRRSSLARPIVPMRAVCGGSRHEPWPRQGWVCIII